MYSELLLLGGKRNTETTCFPEVARVLCEALPSKGSAAAIYLEKSSGRGVDAVPVLVLNSMDFPAASHG